MKKHLIAFICFAITLACLTGCGAASSKNAPTTDYKFVSAHARAYKGSDGKNRMLFINEIKNIGQHNLYLLPGSFDIKDPAGKVIISKSNVLAIPQVIKPGESAYYFAEEVSSGNEDTAALPSVVLRATVKISAVECIRLPVTVQKFGQEKKGRLSLTGSIENTTGTEQKDIYVGVAMYNSKDEPIGIMYTKLAGVLAAGDKMDFTLFSDTLPVNDIVKETKHYSVIAFPLQSQT